VVVTARRLRSRGPHRSHRLSCHRRGVPYPLAGGPRAPAGASDRRSPPCSRTRDRSRAPSSTARSPRVGCSRVAAGRASRTRGGTRLRSEVASNAARRAGPATPMRRATARRRRTPVRRAPSDMTSARHSSHPRKCAGRPPRRHRRRSLETPGRAARERQRPRIGLRPGHDAHRSRRRTMLDSWAWPGAYAFRFEAYRERSASRSEDRVELTVVRADVHRAVVADRRRRFDRSTGRIFPQLYAPRVHRVQVPVVRADEGRPVVAQCRR
jgi:hypothetical protein